MQARGPAWWRNRLSGSALLLAGIVPAIGVCRPGRAAEPPRDRGAAAERFAVFKSHNGGETWVRSDAGLPGRSRIHAFGSTGATLFAGTDAEGVVVCAASGQSWVRRSAGLPDRAQVFDLGVAGDRVFAALYGRGLFAWDESRRTWVKAGSVTPLALAGVRGTLIAGHNPGGLHWSADLGASWSKGIAGDQGIGGVGSVTLDQGEALPGAAPVWALAGSEARAFAGAAGGVYYSEDFGRTWIRARGGLPARCPGIAFLVKPEFVLAAALIQ